MKSLYIKPIKKEKKPISAIKYLTSLIVFSSAFFINSLSPKNINDNPTKNNKPPWPISPYITPNRNGNVTI